MASLMSLLYEAGKDNKDFTNWDEETQTKFWTDLETAGTAFAQEIIDYCKENGLGDTAKAAGEAWGFEGLKDDATATDLFWLMAESPHLGPESKGLQRGPTAKSGAASSKSHPSTPGRHSGRPLCCLTALLVWASLAHTEIHSPELNTTGL